MNEITKPILAYDLLGNCEITFCIECSFCYNGIDVYVNELQTREEMYEEFRRELETSGWADLTSEEFGQVGFACPECIEQEEKFREDKLRGQT